MAQRFSDILLVEDEGQLLLPPEVHHLADLLERNPEGVLKAFRQSQQADFIRLLDEMSLPQQPLRGIFAKLERLGPPLFDPAELKDLFLDMHDHVMAHPVWRHPFFVRVFEGRIEAGELNRFALAYFNQIKNTRQCVALALGRFNSLMPLPFALASERVSEMTQIVLAQLLADEYGVGAHALEDYPALAGLLSSNTHILMYRQLFDGLGIPFERQDAPLLSGVADNVLVQRLVAGDPAFTPLEALASVGLGMEWGVPEFFSLLLGGLVRFAWRTKTPLTCRHLQVFIAHVKYDVLHAVSVMLVTAFHMRRAEDRGTVKQSVNLLMSARFGMMTDLYAHVFCEPCERLGDHELETRYRIADRRIEGLLARQRQMADPARLADPKGYLGHPMPFVFA
jgi:hypothetical protein